MSRIQKDLHRFNKIGEESRMDLKEYIKKGNLGSDIKIPIKVIELPEFEYSKIDKGGIGQGDAEIGDPVDIDVDELDGEDGDIGDPGDGEGDHPYEKLDPKEFAKELDEELGLNFEQKGNKIMEEEEGNFTETRKAGPDTLLDIDNLFKQAVKRHSAIWYDREYLKELLRVEGYGTKRVWEWARNNNITVSQKQIENLEKEVTNNTKYKSIDDINRDLRIQPPKQSYKNITFRKSDEKYRSAETIEKPTNNAVIINLRDVSGSMRKNKRELVERIFTPLDWYLQGKYDNVEFVYIAHDNVAWEVDREEFFGIKSGGGTKISTAYKLMKEEILPNYPWESWNRFIFGAGDGENSTNDTRDELIPIMKQIKYNRQAYVEVQPGSSLRGTNNVLNKLEKEFGTDNDKVRLSLVENKDDVLDAIRNILDNKGDNNE